MQGARQLIPEHRRAKSEFHLAALKGADKPDEVKKLKELIESRLPRTELVDVLVDMDHRTDFLRHFLHYGAGETRLPAVERRRNSLAALIAVSFLHPHKGRCDWTRYANHTVQPK